MHKFCIMAYRQGKLSAIASNRMYGKVALENISPTFPFSIYFYFPFDFRILMQPVEVEALLSFLCTFDALCSAWRSFI